MGKNLYLTDAQYLHLLDKIQAEIPKHQSFQVIDSTQIGNKYTTSNIGLCNDNFTELDTAMFPSQFRKHGRMSMKYKQKHHICPFDTRLTSIIERKPTHMGNGCYYTCSLVKKESDKEKLINLVERARELHQSTDSKHLVNELYEQY